jgi:glycosyltransferase involved in cell wall biosynthesis
MIDAINLVVEKYPDASLDLVGHFSYPEEEEQVHKIVKEYDLSQNVNISAPISHTEIPQRISQSAIGLLPFYNIDKFRNNIVIKMFEFSACKLPILSFDLPPSRKYIDSINCGICVEVDSYEALAKGIIQLFENEDQYELYSENGYKAFLEKFHWEAQETQLFDVYTSLIQNI